MNETEMINNIAEMFACAARRHPGAPLPYLDLRVGPGMIRDPQYVYGCIGCENGEAAAVKQVGPSPQLVRFDDLAAVRYIPSRPAEAAHYVLLTYDGRSIELFGSPADNFAPALPAVPDVRAAASVPAKAVEEARIRWSDKHDFDIIDVSGVSSEDLETLELSGVVYEENHVWHYVEA